MATSALTAARVLVADDDPMTLVTVGGVLEKADYKVTTAWDGDELLQQLAEHGPFDLVVTDVSMPWMTGLQVAHCARAAGMKTPVIVISALRIDSSALESLGTNARLLRKPFDQAQLLGAVHALLGGGRSCGERDANRRTGAW